MEKIETKEITVKENIHKFYCDNCNEFLGESQEYDDGYYHEIGEYEESFHVQGVGWYGIHRILCDKCRGEFINKISKSLEDLGFKKD